MKKLSIFFLLSLIHCTHSNATNLELEHLFYGASALSFGYAAYAKSWPEPQFDPMAREYWRADRSFWEVHKSYNVTAGVTAGTLLMVLGVLIQTAKEAEDSETETHHTSISIPATASNSATA